MQVRCLLVAAVSAAFEAARKKWQIIFALWLISWMPSPSRWDDDDMGGVLGSTVVERDKMGKRGMIVVHFSKNIMHL